MGRLMLLTFRITGHFSLFFARLSLRYLENSWYYTFGALLSPSESDKDTRETLKRHPGLDGLFSLYEMRFRLRPSHLDADTPFQLSQKTLLIFALSLRQI